MDIFELAMMKALVPSEGSDSGGGGSVMLYTMTRDKLYTDFDCTTELTVDDLDLIQTKPILVAFNYRGNILYVYPVIVVNRKNNTIVIFREDGTTTTITVGATE